MTETNTQYRSQQQQGREKRVGSEQVRRATIPTRIVPVSTFYLELSVRRNLFDDESITGKTERHPEWYIG